MKNKIFPLALISLITLSLFVSFVFAEGAYANEQPGILSIFISKIANVVSSSTFGKFVYNTGVSNRGNCVCAEIYEPVCGSNGKTYSNGCVATCGGIKIACNKACPCRDVIPEPPIEEQCKTDVNCDDNNLCTKDLCKNGKCVSSEITCPLNAKCNPKTGKCESVPPLPPSPNITCTDSDGGKDYYVKGVVKTDSESKVDSCTYCTGECQPRTNCTSTCFAVEEYYCIERGINKEVYNCPNGCKDGACINDCLSFCQSKGYKRTMRASCKNAQKEYCTYVAYGNQTGIPCTGQYDFCCCY